MKQFILNEAPDGEGFVRLSGGDYRYLARARRLAPGEFFPALLPDGGKVLLQVRSVDRQTLTAQLAANGESANASLALPPVFLFQALPKGEKMDLIVRQAAECGLDGVVPFVSEFSLVKNYKDCGRKILRWERIVKEARQQCGSATATAVKQPLSIDGLFAYWEELKTERPGALGLLFHHAPLAKTSLHEYLNSIPPALALVIGPEGGFSPAEAGRFLAAGFKPATVGDTILRTETAALYMAAAVRILLLEKDKWEIRQQRNG